MKELITNRHSIGKCATSKGNKSIKAVDGIWGTRGIKIEDGGYLPFHTGIVSDHRLLWIRISLKYVFGHIKVAMRRPAARNLRMDGTKGQRIYNSTSNKFLKHHKVKERFEKLNESASYPPTPEQCLEYESLDKLRVIGALN